MTVMPFEGRSVEQAVKVRMDTRPSFPVDLIVRTPEMIEERLSMGDTFINDILEKGERRSGFQPDIPIQSGSTGLRHKLDIFNNKTRLTTYCSKTFSDGV